MAYAGLGPRRLTAVADTSGLNPGNWTTDFSPAVLAVRVPWFEVYRGVVQNVPAGTYAVIQVGIMPVSFTNPQGGSEWDPNQPVLMQPGQSLYFLWSAAAAGTAPAVTLWLRYDPAVIEAARMGWLQ